MLFLIRKIKVKQKQKRIRSCFSNYDKVRSDNILVFEVGTVNMMRKDKNIFKWHTASTEYTNYKKNCPMGLKTLDKLGIRFISVLNIMF